MIRLFRLIAAIEGVTTLALFLFAMPLKYFFDQPQYVPAIGLAHGIAFVVYLAAVPLLLRNRRLTQAEWARTTTASLYPFGTIINDPMLRRKQAQRAAAVG